METKIDKALKNLLREAELFHGHLGPFLVLGVRMGVIAMKKLCENENSYGLRVVVNIPLSTPYSCIIDGIQVATRCTVGNGKLELKNQSDFSTHFFSKTTKQAITISVNRDFLIKLQRRLVSNLSDKALRKIALEVATAPVEELFNTTSHT